MKEKGALILFPNVLGKGVDARDSLPEGLADVVAGIDGIIAESTQGGRSFLKKFKTKKKPHNMPLAIFNKDSEDDDIDFLLEPLADGERWGYVSDAGLPCIADPGNELVNGARAKGFDVEAYSGPSSIFLALMLSGLQGQRFTFHGYISKEKEQRENEMKDMEAYAQECHATQIFIEAPYRNVHTFQSLIEVLGDETLLCVACDLTLPTQEVICRCVGHWKKTTMPDIAKKPAIFLIA